MCILLAWCFGAPDTRNKAASLYRPRAEPGVSVCSPAVNEPSMAVEKMARSVHFNSVSCESSFSALCPPHFTFSSHSNSHTFLFTYSRQSHGPQRNNGGSVEMFRKRPPPGQCLCLQLLQLVEKYVKNLNGAKIFTSHFVNVTESK